MNEHAPQTVSYPGHTADMAERPRDEMRDYTGSGLLTGSKALITGGDSGIGRAVAAAFAKEGADVCVVYLEEDADAEYTGKLVTAQGQRFHHIRTDLAEPANCRDAVAEAVRELGGLNIVVNNVAYQWLALASRLPSAGRHSPMR